jgi:hypothetical protein
MEVRQGSGGFPPYVFSGRTPIFGLLFGTVAGAAAAVVLSGIYVLGTVFIPIVQIEFLLTAAFGAAIGAATGGVMHFFKVRSLLVVALVSFCLGVFGWLVSWPPWIFTVFWQADIPISPLDVLNPLFLMDAIPQIYETGTWSIGRGSSEAVSGLFLGFIWLCEAGIIVLTSTFVGAAMSGDKVFCERCETWCTMLRDQALYDQSFADAIRDGLAQRADLSVLSTAPLPQEPMDPRRWGSLKLGFCPSCGETNVVGLELVAQTINSKGQTETTNVEHLGYVCISRDQMQWLRNGVAQRASGVAPPPGGPTG